MLTERQILDFGFVPVEEDLQRYPGMFLYRHPVGTYIGKDAKGKYYYVDDGIKPVSLEAAELQMYKNTLVTLIKRANCVDEIKDICAEFCTEKQKDRLGLWLRTSNAINPHPYRIPPIIVELITNKK